MNDQVSVDMKKWNPKGGRPGMADPRKITLSTRVNRAEKAIVDEKILSSGMKPSEAIRLLLLNEKLPAVVHKGIDITASAAYQNLQPLQSNLNQIAHHLNSEKTSQFDQAGIAQIVKFVRAVEAELKSIRQEIIGAQEA